MGLSLTAIAAGLGVAVVLSALVGLILGAAILSDSGANPADPKGEEAFEHAATRPAVLVQLCILSLVIAVLSGAVTVWFDPPAGLDDSAVVGGIGAVLGLVLPAPPGFPRLLRIAMALATLPATMLGAWGLTAFTS